jgi:FlaA1/EpsC-like NDP-sugar epimerase
MTMGTKFEQNKTISDLFNQMVGRPETELLSSANIRNFFGDERILIIGAGGSIGSALAKTINSAQISNLFLLDRDESALHGVALELFNDSASHSQNFFIGDIRDRSSISQVMDQIKPSMVIHAAALKHLPILERFPREGFLTNIIGTLNVAELCVEKKVKQFVNISTDKAARPISVLGKTKKLAELITEELYVQAQLKHCSVRFGNVFASRGSVIETFVHQIRNNMPVTVTDPLVCRFFMTQNEAANLVLAAASLQESGTYIQNMGGEVPIIDIVQKIAEYYGQTPEIKFTGLKSGEKLHEELFDGPVLATKYETILRSVHEEKSGLVKEVKSYIPSNNEEAIAQIEKLTKKYI